MSNSTQIRLKRTLADLSNNISPKLTDQDIKFGECLFIDNNASTGQKCNSYLAIGTPVKSEGVFDDSANGKVKDAAFFKGFWDVTKADSLVFFKNNREGLCDESGADVYADKIMSTPVNINSETDDSQYYILCQSESNRDVRYFKVGVNEDPGSTVPPIGVYISGKGVMHGAAWNDYAEKRAIVSAQISDITPGTVVCESGDGTLRMSYERLQACAYVVSDTYGIVIGDDKDTPVAIAGRVLVKTDSENIKVGDCLCAGAGGKAYVMTREEIKEFPDRILGIVTEIPTYEEWNGVKINNRIWIKIK